MEYAGNILVEDASGCRFNVYEFVAWRFLSRVARFELDTGEAVDRLDPDTFVIRNTGEALTRSAAPNSPCEIDPG